MCEQRVALEMLEKQEGNGGLSPAAMLLHKKQCEDYEKMDKRMTKIERDVAEIKAVQADTSEKIDTILQLLNNKKPSIFDKIVDIKYFWFWLILTTAAVCGVNFEHIVELWKQ